MMTANNATMEKLLDSAKLERSLYMSGLAKKSGKFLNTLFVSELRNTREVVLNRLQAA